MDCHQYHRRELCPPIYKINADVEGLADFTRKKSGVNETTIKNQRILEVRALGSGWKGCIVVRGDEVLMYGHETRLNAGSGPARPSQAAAAKLLRHNGD